MNGVLVNTNTIEEYKAIDIHQKSTDLLKDAFCTTIKEGTWTSTPGLLNSFLLVSFANLKQYVYQFCFNSLVIQNHSVEVTKSKLLHKAYKNQADKLVQLKSALISYLSENEKDVQFNSPFLVYSEEINKIVGIEDVLKSPSSHIILFVDPSPKQPSSVIKNLLFAIATRADSDS